MLKGRFLRGIMALVLLVGQCSNLTALSAQADELPNQTTASKQQAARAPSVASQASSQATQSSTTQPKAPEWLTLTFMTGSTAWKQTRVAPGTSVNMPANPPAGAGQVAFEGWFTAPTGGKQYYFPRKVTKSQTLYAHFSDKYLINFKDADGKVIDSKTVAPGELIPKTTTAVTPPTGEHFDYWMVEGDTSQKAFDFKSTKAKQNLVLVPKFSAQRTIIFFSEGSQVDPEYVKENGRVTQPAAPKRDGYQFVRWSTQRDGATAYDFATPVKSNVTLYAVWAPIQVKYTIAYWLEKPNISGDAGTTKSNYRYAWSTTATTDAGNNVTIDQTKADQLKNGDTAGVAALRYGEYGFSESKKVSGNGQTVINVYYKRIVYKIDFNLNSNTHTTSMSANGQTYYGDGEQYQLAAKYGQDIGQYWPTNYFSATSVFDTWAGAPILLVTKQLVMNASMLPVGDPLRYTLTANWSTNQTRIPAIYMFESLDGTGTEYNDRYYQEDERYRDLVTNMTLLAKDIPGFDDVHATVVRTPEAYTLYYPRKQYTLAYNPVGGQLGKDTNDSIMPYQKKITQPADPTRTGYTFAGWYQDANYREKVDFTHLTMPDSNLTLYAKWESISHKVNYFDDLNGTWLFQQGYGTDEYVNFPAEYVKGDTFTNGKGVFNGWFWQIGESDVEFADTIPMTRDIDLFAKWLTSGYRVSYLAGNGTGTVPQDPDSYDLTKQAVVKAGPDLVAPAAKTFIGWTSNRDTSVHYATDKMAVHGDTKLTAVYANKADLIALTYHAGDYDGHPAAVSQVVLGQSNVDLKGAIFNRKGKTLVGWSKTPNGAKDYDLEQAGVALGQTDTDLYAVWQAQSVNVTFVPGDNGTLDYGGQGATVSTDYGNQWQDRTFAIPTVVPDAGYKFAGWSPALPAETDRLTSDQFYTAQFVKKVAGSVTVRYLNEQGKQIAADKLISGIEGDHYDVSGSDYAIQKLGDYDLIATPENAQGTYNESNTLVIYRYRKRLPVANSTVTVKYLDEHGQTLKDDLVVTAKPGTSYDLRTSEVAIKGYHHVKTTGNLQGTVTSAPIIITHQYAKDAAAQSQIKVTYEDEQGQSLHAPLTLTKPVGATYDVRDSQRQFAGYHYVKTIGALQGIVASQPMTIRHQYAKTILPAAVGQVSVRYIDQATGQTLHAPSILQGTVGDDYQVAPIAIAGYQFTGVTGNLTGQYSVKPQVVTLSYAKVVVDKAIQQPQPEAPKTESQSVAKNNQSPSTTAPVAMADEVVASRAPVNRIFNEQTPTPKTKLPQTQEHEVKTLWIGIGFVVLALASMSYGYAESRRRQRH
ncbi:InlB B-repeat-containing protein [Lactiplantibacillus sp. WILCCON 0030]|uniref:InlB B-repeat-containing protein n=1 Tax=Lactiplantibacillus brownii TaxID=3069269 RepID=A0ABU1A6U2_9LACO|nr:InlB B-repeat-containing protein [Lactiplantibacillus brownii]MDQ7936657.1 InlB B-repeat-containing protein [Lactiplantibacillus brownii]